MKKQKLLSVIILFFFACALSAQVRMNQIEPYSKSYKNTNQFKKSSVALLSENKIDSRVIAADKGLFFREHKGISPSEVAAIKVKANYNLKNSGTWEQLKEGRLWRLKISASNASSLNFVFSEFYIPKGASLTIANEDKTQVMGPFTSANNRENKTFATHLIYTSDVVLEYFEPKSVKQKGKLTIGSIGYGITEEAKPKENFAKKTGGANFTVPNDPCSYPLENANCASANDIAEFRRAVCEILIDLPDHFGQGTGTLVNNAEEDCRPLVLTAGHNFPPNASTNPDHLQNMVFRFNYLRTGCSGTTPVDVSEVIDYCGANFVANWLPNSHDLGVLEMQIVPTYKEYYAGWYNNWDWLNSFSATVDTKLLGHPENQAMKYYEGDLRAAGQFDPRIIIDLNYDHFIQTGASGSPFINSNKEMQAVLSTSSHLGCVSFSRLTGFDLFTVWESSNWIPPATPPTTWLEDILDPNNVLPVVNGMKRLAGKERGGLGCTSNTGNCCMVTNVSFTEEVVTAQPTSEGFTCCNTLRIEMKDEYISAGCGNSFLVKVFEAGSATPLVNSTLTLPSDQTICRDLATGSTFPNTEEYEIQIIDPNTGTVLDQCKSTLSFECEGPDPCCENFTVQINPQNILNSCCFDIVGSVGTCFETQTIELFELIGGNWLPVGAPVAPNPGGTFSFNNICREEGEPLTFRIVLRDAAGEIICEREINHSCPDCCDVVTPVLTPVANAITHHDGFSYLRCCWDVNIPWQQGENCEIGGWLLLDEGTPVPPTTFIFLPPNSNLGTFCSNDSTLDLTPFLGQGQSQTVTLNFRRVLAVYDVNGDLLCTKIIEDSCQITFYGPTSGGFELVASPNPFDNALDVKLEVAKTMPLLIEIYDNIGRRVFIKDYGVQKEGTFETSIDVSGFAKGLYRLRVNKGEQVLQIYKE